MFLVPPAGRRPRGDGAAGPPGHARSGRPVEDARCHLDADARHTRAEAASRIPDPSAPARGAPMTAMLFALLIQDLWHKSASADLTEAKVRPDSRMGPILNRGGGRIEAKK